MFKIIHMELLLNYYWNFCRTSNTGGNDLLKIEEKKSSIRSKTEHTIRIGGKILVEKFVLC